MNKPTKPISSPGRTTAAAAAAEKFPPPLMRFLRSNVGNKSRRRSRASPMFVRKKTTLIEATQEPSSPKVTCIGQVRVRRSKKKTHKTTNATNNRNRHGLCRCLRSIKPFSCTNIWSRWASFFRCWRCKSSRINTKDAPQHQQEENSQEEEENERVSIFRCVSYKNSGKNRQQQQHKQNMHKHQQQPHRQEEHVTSTEVDNVNESLISRTPPRNAFLLTRCRSAPYRSSSLANIFRESMMEKSDEEEVEDKMKKLKIEKKDDDDDDDEEEEGTYNESDGCEELKEVPLILSRCKSEPARTWDQLLRL